MRDVCTVIDDLYDLVQECETILSNNTPNRHASFLMACFKLIRLKEELGSFVGWREARIIVTLALQDMG